MTPHTRTHARSLAPSPPCLAPLLSLLPAVRSDTDSGGGGGGVNRRRHPSQRAVQSVRRQICAVRHVAYRNISELHCAVTIPPIITKAQPLAMTQHIQSPGETVTRQQGWELMAPPQPALHTANYSFLCQHRRKVGSSSPLTCSGALTALHRSENDFQPAAPTSRVFLQVEQITGRTEDVECEIKAPGEDFPTSGETAPSHQPRIRESNFLL